MWGKIGLLLLGSSVAALAQTSVPIHVSIVMHSEQSARYDVNPVLFEQSRTNLYRFASMLASHGVMFNFQSDWTFLAGVTNYDRTGRPETAGTNIIAWMHNTLGFDIDPHNHVGQSIFNYADVAALVRRCGVEPTAIVGGFIALPVTNSEWALFQGTLTGAVYTGDTWTPGALWGGGTGNHINETNLWFSGVYSPLDGTNFWTHQPGNLPVIGKYTGPDFNFTNLDALVAMRAAGLLCTNRMYTVNLMTHMSSLPSPGYILQFATALAARTNLPNIRWVGLTEMKTIWETEYASRPSYLPFNGTNDLDADGLTDGWEVTNFCGIADSDGSGDTDGDHQDDGEEFIAGTSPTNDADYFAITAMTNAVITWRAEAGRTYIVERSTTNGLWQGIHTNAGVSPAMSFTNAPFQPVAMLRVRIL